MAIPGHHDARSRINAVAINLPARMSGLQEDMEEAAEKIYEPEYTPAQLVSNLRYWIRLIEDANALKSGDRRHLTSLKNLAVELE